MPRHVSIGYQNLIWRWTNFKQTKPYTDLNDKQIKNLENIIRIQRRFKITVMTWKFHSASEVDWMLTTELSGEPNVICLMTNLFQIKQSAILSCCQWHVNLLNVDSVRTILHDANEMKNTEPGFYQFIRWLSPIIYFSRFFFETFSFGWNICFSPQGLFSLERRKMLKCTSLYNRPNSLSHHPTLISIIRSKWL